MRTGRKNRKKNRKSRGYIVPMCLALSGTLMAGTATAGPDIKCEGVINNEYKNHYRPRMSFSGSKLMATL